MDAIGQGILQGDITATVYFSGCSKAFALLGDLIAGYETPEPIGMFCYHGGGRELLQEAFDTYADGNVQVVGCGAIARESFTSKVPIRGIEDLMGVKVRSPEGLAATVFERAGASARGAAVLRGLHLARQGRDRHSRLQLLHHESVGPHECCPSSSFSQARPPAARLSRLRLTGPGAAGSLGRLRTGSVRHGRDSASDGR